MVDILRISLLVADMIMLFAVLHTARWWQVSHAQQFNKYLMFSRYHVSEVQGGVIIIKTVLSTPGGSQFIREHKQVYKNNSYLLNTYYMKGLHLNQSYFLFH